MYTMLIELRESTADITVETTADGSLVLQNKVPLASAPANLGSWLHQCAGRSPRKPFLLERARGGAWEGVTYAQALAQVNRISNGLVDLRLSPARPIAILAENSIDTALLKLAAMQIGMAVVLFSFDSSLRSVGESLVNHVLDLCGSTLLVLSDARKHLPKLKLGIADNYHIFTFRNSDAHVGVRPFADLFHESTFLTPESQRRFDAVSADTLAKIQFTTGSTNQPKGVEVTHGMITANTVAMSQAWPFLNGDDVILDWHPWDHTFGGNFVFNSVLMHGATFYLDNGKPTEAGFGATVENICHVSPTLYYETAHYFAALYQRMTQNEELKQAFFKNLKFIFPDAAMDPSTHQGLLAMSAEVRGESIPYLSGWGCTETAPVSTIIFWKTNDAREIGLPIAGVKLKLTPDASGKMELRVKGPHVTPGYYHNEQATRAAFDEEGYYCTGDAGRLLDPDHPSKGLIFEGRFASVI
jgi:feruloyl-CoA synthase